MRLLVGTVVAIALAAAAVTLAAQPSWTESARTMTEMRAGAGGDLSTAQLKLDAAFKAALDATEVDSAQRRSLVASQKAWEAYVEAHESALYACAAGEYGDTMSLCWSLEKTTLVEQRIDTLEGMLARQGGEDICYWVRPCSSHGR